MRHLTNTSIEYILHILVKLYNILIAGRKMHEKKGSDSSLMPFLENIV